MSGALLAIFSILSASANIGGDFDASYFTDANRLQPGGAGLTGKLDVERLPEAKQAFCGRNEFDVARSLNADWTTKISFHNPEGFWGAVNKKLGHEIFGTGL